MNECVICNKPSGEENFCIKHEKEGYHFCENCGAITKHSIYAHEVGGVVCKECSQKYKKFDRSYNEFLKECEK